MPRPAMLVAIVSAPFCPAPATIFASRSWYFALSTSWVSPRRLSIFDNVSETSTDVVPISAGRPSPCSRSTSSSTALYFSRRVL